MNSFDLERNILLITAILWPGAASTLLKRLAEEL
jgi:hypothetical protein